MPMADFIFVSKSKKLLFLMKDGIAFKSYRIALGRNQFGSKLYEGDMRTPEGLYTIDYEELPSNYHLSLHIDYPHSDDIERAQKFGRPPGGDIMIHGEPDHLGLISYFFELIGWENYRNFTNNILYTFNWTRGCIAVRNHEIEEIFRHVPNGTKIWIQR
ncbi:MAG: hypothetical protein A2504_13945 [Bdellovibrionales bacterium RIFOXYD12_FULL_39_22]|nr:MAG: hypothetical protein A2385_00670 [Bdellovibrionales bacterium RIFOXYB1_FULL_39_21]OFZ43893.1 MAG: hypothetical protein A2485_04860 [Bdellovibrionales bacterium RIFOXYC12_FULL_39_17]OFZ48872.1 MAG: hypothetical protein A2404_17985 [Bdellovibrionales bacterium RIFOXYC1_FULL_39_130]OFZ76605.1 MAG: hypothetical protein A2560_06650 [Bdellovibrionales bacterium RIFOXYD1_FULL_39_84]OFZ94839.1 MAG: hypothetical protein A2504_13945 [Bdellovibrionales bacterium RIFOXYD12_FULL_39_22]